MPNIIFSYLLKAKTTAKAFSAQSLLHIGCINIYHNIEINSELPTFQNEPSAKQIQFKPKATVKVFLA
jgi:hypothetical protein